VRAVRGGGFRPPRSAQGIRLHIPTPRSAATPACPLRLLVALALALPLGALACGEARPPDILLITLDTLRADHLGPYAAGAPPTPNVDALARTGTVFERAAAPMGMTRPSHYSIFTSRYPREHGVLNNQGTLPESELTLAEVLRLRGYRTAGFAGVALFGADSGAQQGFERVDLPRDTRQRRAHEVVPKALRWLEELGPDERFFLWVHLFDPHQPYDPPAGFRQGLDAELQARFPRIRWRELEAIARGNGGNVPAAILEHALGLYRGEVSFTDHWVGVLLQGLHESRDLDETLVVLTADHGECFELGIFFEHTDCLYQGTTRVPLIVRYPRLFSAGSRVASQVSLIDVAPTVLAALGEPIPPVFSGRPLQRHGDLPDRGVLLQHPFYQDVEMRRARSEIIRSVAGIPTVDVLAGKERVGLVGREWKYIETDGGSPELYRMAPIFDEGRNLAEARPEVRGELQARLEELLERHPLELRKPSQLSPELRETLRALGYLQ